MQQQKNFTEYRWNFKCSNSIWKNSRLQLSYSKEKINTLILVQSKDLLIQWTEELNKFLEIDEKPPMYETKSGRKRQRKSVIGILHGSKNSLTGIVDVAMVGSMYSKGKFKRNQFLWNGDHGRMPSCSVKYSN